ncbi:MAG: hypothetical protein AAF585_21490, partial [Verrucomicrobiota bacterium]
MAEPDTKPDFKPWIDPDLEARIVAMVLGEASDFESEQLERSIGERRELQIFQRYIEAAHEQLSSIGSGKFEDESGFADAGWRLEAGKRASLLEALAKPSPEAAEEIAANSIPTLKKSKKTTSLYRKVIWGFGSAAAGFCILCGGLTMLGLMFSGGGCGDESYAPDSLALNSIRGRQYDNEYAGAGSDASEPYAESPVPASEPTSAPAIVAATPVPMPVPKPPPPAPAAPALMPMEPPVDAFAPASGGAMSAPGGDSPEINTVTGVATGGLAIVDPAAAKVATEGQMWGGFGGVGGGSGGVAVNGPAPKSDAVPERAPTNHFLWSTESEQQAAAVSGEAADPFGLTVADSPDAPQVTTSNGAVAMDTDFGVFAGAKLSEDFGGGPAIDDEERDGDGAMPAAREAQDIAQIGSSGRQLPGHGQVAPIELGERRFAEGGFAESNEALARESKSDDKRKKIGPRGFAMEAPSLELTPPSRPASLTDEALIGGLGANLAKTREKAAPETASRLSRRGQEVELELRESKEAELEELGQIVGNKELSEASRQLKDLEDQLGRNPGDSGALAQMFGDSRMDSKEADVLESRI